MKKLLLILLCFPFLVSSQDLNDWFPKKNLKDSGTKIALVIGNTDYKGVSKLINPINDAKLIYRTLAELDFDKVIFKKDLKYNEMRTIFLEYYDLQSNYDFSFIYYAGHGVQDERGNSYLIPVDFQADTKLEESAISVRELLLLFSDKEENKNLFVFDACRESYNTGMPKPDIKEPVNIKLGFSTSFGYVAYDHPELDNSIYTSILSKALKNTDLTIYQILQSTWNQVYINTHHKQSPAAHFGYLLDNDYLK